MRCSLERAPFAVLDPFEALFREFTPQRRVWGSTGRSFEATAASTTAR
jgi:hypothetical protein